MDVALLLTLGLNALSLILILILIAMGLAIVFGLMGVINLAHGEFFMLGAYVVFVTTAVGLNVWWGLLFAPLILAGVGLLLERGVIQYLYKRPLETVLATWGVSIVLRQVVEIGFGRDFQYIPHPLPGSFTLFGLEYPLYRTFVMGAAILIIACSYFILQRTTWGLNIRAAIDNPEMALALGINTAQIYRFTFAYGAALAGLAGALMAPLVSIHPGMGLDFVVEAFFVVIVGGLGKLVGLAAGAISIGATQSILSFFSNAVVARIVVLLLAIGILQIRPKGLFST